MKREDIPRFRWRIRRIMGLLALVQINLSFAMLAAKWYDIPENKVPLFMFFTVITIVAIYVQAALYKLSDELWKENSERVEHEKRWLNSTSPKTEVVVMAILILAVYLCCFFWPFIR